MGHPVLFPNILSGSTKRPTFQIRVPVDDTHTRHIWYTCYARDDSNEPQEVIPYYEVPVPGFDKDEEPQWSLSKNSGKDIAAWITQGEIADRPKKSSGYRTKGLFSTANC